MCERLRDKAPNERCSRPVGVYFVLYFNHHVVLLSETVLLFAIKFFINSVRSPAALCFRSNCTVNSSCAF